jgi:hypothetical protein
MARKQPTIDYAALLRTKRDYAHEEANRTGVDHYVTLAGGSSYGGSTYQVHRADRFNMFYRDTIQYTAQPCNGELCYIVK